MVESARIVVGVDGSEASLDAVRWAASEAARRQASIELVTATSIVPHTPLEALDVLTDTLGDRDAAAAAGSGRIVGGESCVGERCGFPALPRDAEADGDALGNGRPAASSAIGIARVPPCRVLLCLSDFYCSITFSV